MVQSRAARAGRAILGAMVLGGLVAGSAQAQLGGMINGQDVHRLVELARQYGPAEARPADNGEGPWVRAEMGDVIYSISLLNCENGAACSSLQLRAWWESGGAHSLEAMNAWNRDRRFGAAYLDVGGNATIEFDVNLAHGVTAANFDDTLQWWQVVLDQFQQQVINPGYDAAGAARGLSK